MQKLTSTNKAKLKAAKSSIEKIADTLQSLQDELAETGNHEASDILEEIGISLGYCINEIDENFLT